MQTYSHYQITKVNNFNVNLYYIMSYKVLQFYFYIRITYMIIKEISSFKKAVRFCKFFKENVGLLVWIERFWSPSSTITSTQTLAITGPICCKG